MIRTEEILARDLMHADPVCLTVSTPIREAVQTLEEYGISGAPVVNEGDEVVGVLSASDIVKTEHLQGDRLGASRPAYYAYDPLWDNDEDADPFREAPPFGSEDYSPETLGREMVGDWMTDRVIHVAPDATLHEVCRVMDGEQIHRVFVVDGRQLLGVISTFDIVSFLARG